MAGLALSYVDGVHATPHVPVDVKALGADFYATSAYKWSGPHVGAVVARSGTAIERCKNPLRHAARSPEKPMSGVRGAQVLRLEHDHQNPAGARTPLGTTANALNKVPI